MSGRRRVRLREPQPGPRREDTGTPDHGRAEHGEQEPSAREALRSQIGNARVQRLLRDETSPPAGVLIGRESPAATEEQQDGTIGGIAGVIGEAFGPKPDPVLAAMWSAAVVEPVEMAARALEEGTERGLTSAYDLVSGAIEVMEHVVPEVKDDALRTGIVVLMQRLRFVVTSLSFYVDKAFVELPEVIEWVEAMLARALKQGTELSGESEEDVDDEEGIVDDIADIAGSLFDALTSKADPIISALWESSVVSSLEQSLEFLKGGAVEAWTTVYDVLSRAMEFLASVVETIKDNALRLSVKSVIETWRFVMALLAPFASKETMSIEELRLNLEAVGSVAHKHGDTLSGGALGTKEE